LRKTYTMKQIANYARIAPLPHPDLLQYIFYQNFKKYTDIKDSKAYNQRAREMLFACKLYNRENLVKHKEREDAYLLSKKYLIKVLGNHQPEYQIAFRTLFEKATDYYFYIDHNEKHHKNKGLALGWTKKVDIKTDGNVAYTTLNNAVKIIINYFKTQDIDTYIKKYEYYKNKNRSPQDIIIEKALEEQGIKKKAYQTIEVDLKEFNRLYIPQLQRKIKEFEEHLNKKIPILDHLKIKAIGNPISLYYAKELNEHKRMLRELGTLKSYTSGNYLFINKNIVDTGRDYHFLTYFSKRFRKEFFEDKLNFIEFDISNAAFKIIAYEFTKGLKNHLKGELKEIRSKIKEIKIQLKSVKDKDLKKDLKEKLFNLKIEKNKRQQFLRIGDLLTDKVRSIVYYSHKRDEVFRDALKYINVRPNSTKGKNLKSIMKVEFLAMLFGKSTIEQLVPYEEWGYFEDFCSYIQQDLKEVKEIVYNYLKEYYENKFGINTEKRNIISKIFMSIESQIMNASDKVIDGILPGTPRFRLHDALYVMIPERECLDKDSIKKFIKQRLNEEVKTFGVKYK